MSPSSSASVFVGLIAASSFCCGCSPAFLGPVVEVVVAAVLTMVKCHEEVSQESREIVCVCVRERERERVCVCVCVCACYGAEEVM